MIKSPEEIEKMRVVGKMVAQVLSRLAPMVKPGVSTLELDQLAEKWGKELGARPAFKGYQGYPFSLCTSVNEEVVHGMPRERELKEGDIIGLDFGLEYNGFFGDSAITVGVGKVNAEAENLMRVTLLSLYEGIAKARAGNTLKDVARGVEKVAEASGYGVVKEFVGHGIGKKLHEEPQVPNYSAGASNIVLRPGMTIAIEPMITQRHPKVKVLEDKWTAVTVDKGLSAHFEHTILIQDGPAEILTSWGEKPFGEFYSDVVARAKPEAIP